MKLPSTTLSSIFDADTAEMLPLFFAPPDFYEPASKQETNDYSDGTAQMTGWLI